MEQRTAFKKFTCLVRKLRRLLYSCNDLADNAEGSKLEEEET